MVVAAGSPAGATLEDGEDAEILKLGEKVYNLQCRSCHMPYGNSRIKRLRLSDDIWKYGSSLKEIEELVAEGIEATQMQPFKGKLSPKEIHAVSLYVLSLSKKE